MALNHDEQFGKGQVLFLLLAVVFGVEIVNAQQSCMESDTQYLHSTGELSRFTDQQDVPDFRPWGFVCCQATATDFRATLQQTTLFETPPGSGEGSCNGLDDETNALIQLKVDQKSQAELAGKCTSGLVPCQISLKGNLARYLDRRRPCTYRPVIALACSLNPEFQGLIRTNLAYEQVQFVDENVAPKWNTGLLDLGSISEYSLPGTWLLIPQVRNSALSLSVSELEDIRGSEHWNVTLSVRRKGGAVAMIEFSKDLTVYPSADRNQAIRDLTHPALRLARSISYESCKNIKVSTREVFN